jgi:hypothetical protein
MTRGRIAVFYAIVVALSVALALAVGELAVRASTVTTGDGDAPTDARWNATYWTPVNRAGYRDVEWEAAGDRPALVFVGDSFTEGHGVAFDQTFYHHLRTLGAGRAAFYNLGQSGASTAREQANYQRFRDATGVRPAVVVYQYFGNDIEDRVSWPEWQPPALLAWSAKHSELAAFVDSSLAARHWGDRYADALFAAYADDAAYAPHGAEVRALLGRFRADGARVVLLVFPYLDDDGYLQRSGVYEARVRAEFAAACRPGDLRLDVDALARRLPPRERVVNRMDGHPSPRLHALLAEAMAPALGLGSGKLDTALWSGCPAR